MDTTLITQRAKMLLIAWWARLNWKTTALGFLSAAAVVLQRIPDTSPHWQDVVAAVLLTVLGSLAIDPSRLPAPTSPSAAPAVVAWGRLNWKTTALGFLSAAAVVLQRIPDTSPHWQDVVAALLLAGLGVLAIDPNRVTAPATVPDLHEPAPPSPSPPQ